MVEPAIRLAKSPALELPIEALDRQVECLQDVPDKADIVPEQVAADVAATMAGVSPSTWWRLHAAAEVPKPNKLGGRTLWGASTN